MTEAIINLQALLVKSYLLNALLMNRKAFPIGYGGAGADSRQLQQPGQFGRR